MRKQTSIKVASIILDAELQARGGLDQEHVADIRDGIKKHARIKCARVMEVLDRDGKIYAIDQHRIAAYRDEGKEVVPVQLLTGTWQDARDLASSANIEHHALKRSRDDKRRAVLMYLEDHPAASDGMAAQHCGVSSTFVGEQRPKVPAAAAVPVQQRESRDGVKRQFKPRHVNNKPDLVPMPDDQYRYEGILAKFVSISRDINDAINSEGGEKLLAYLTYFKLIVYPQDVFRDGETKRGEPKFRGFPGLKRVIRFAALPGTAKSEAEVREEYKRTTDD